MVKRVNVSIKENDVLFCRQGGYSPSKLLRKAIYELRNQIEGGVDFKAANIKLQRKIEAMQETIQKAMDYLAERGLIDEFSKKC